MVMALYQCHRDPTLAWRTEARDIELLSVARCLMVQEARRTPKVRSHGCQRTQTLSADPRVLRHLARAMQVLSIWAMSSRPSLPILPLHRHLNRRHTMQILLEGTRLFRTSLFLVSRYDLLMGILGQLQVRHQVRPGPCPSKRPASQQAPWRCRRTSQSGRESGPPDPPSPRLCPCELTSSSASERPPPSLQSPILSAGRQ